MKTVSETIVYSTLRGEQVYLRNLDDEERELLDEIQQRAAEKPDWNDFENYWTKAVAQLYDTRGVPRAESVKSPLYRVSQDLGNRIGIESGLMRMPDYRDELQYLIHTSFKSRRAFCQATGISEDMLSHVLARRKHLSIETLEKALAKIGRKLHIMPLETTASQE